MSMQPKKHTWMQSAYGFAVIFSKTADKIFKSSTVSTHVKTATTFRQATNDRMKCPQIAG